MDGEKFNFAEASVCVLEPVDGVGKAAISTIRFAMGVDAIIVENNVLNLCNKAAAFLLGIGILFWNGSGKLYIF